MKVNMKKIFIILFSLLIANSAFAAPLKTSLDKLLKSFKGGELVKIPSFTAAPWPNHGCKYIRWVV